MKRLAYRLMVATLCVVGFIGVASSELADAEAPDFVLKAADGKNYRLSEYRGQVVLLSFWASWCGECRSQLEGLVEQYTRFAGADFEMLAVSLDRDRDDVVDAARSLGIQFPALHDLGGDVGEQYDVDDLPWVLLIDRDGVVRAEYSGYDRGQEIEYLDRVRSLLAE